MATGVTVRSRLDAVARFLPDTIDEALRHTTEVIRDNVRHEMRQPKHGRVYPGPHVASARGEAPAIRPFPFYPTGGELYASISTARVAPFEWRVWTAIPYSAFLEYGTSKMRPRPFMRPAARKAAQYLRRTEMRKVKVQLESAPW